MQPLRFSKSKFFIAVIAFSALSLVAGAFKFWQSKPTDYPYHSWTAWAIDDFLQQQRAPQVVFLGSSLMLVPLAGVDADYLNHRLDGTAHHRSLYFENGLREKTGLNARSFNFALPGEMPSDAYMITDFLLKGERQPDLIVYGVGPRDFMDNLLPSPAATDPFRFLSRFGDISDCAGLMMPEFYERFSYELGRTVYFYGHKTDLCDRWSALAWQELSTTFPALKLMPRAPREVVAKLLPEYRPFDLQPGEAFFRPSSPQDRSNFTDNLSEYRKRYKKLKKQTFDTQMRFFHDTLESAKQRGTRVVVVAMPITDLNRQLLSDQSWKLYNDNIRAIAAEQGAIFVDAAAHANFSRADFGDTVHLHSGGGKRFMDMLIAQLAANQAVTAALRDSSSKSDTVCGVGGGAL